MPLRILIVGGGIAGLALARALKEQNVAIEVIERAAAWPESGTGLYIPANGLRMLGTLGLAARVLEQAVPISHQRMLDHTGRALAEIELQAFWGPVGHCVAIARGELHRILREGALGVRIRLDASVTALSQNADEVDVVFADGSTGRYDLVVGADGIHSSIRQLVFGSVAPRHLGQVSWRFLADNPAAIDTWTVMLGPRRAFLMMPVGQNRLYCYADLASHATDDPTERDPVRLRALFSDFAEPVQSIVTGLERADSIHYSPIEEVALDSWVRGRVVLLGDAAHATSPNMAEGASMALEDAVVLATMLSTPRPLPESLAAFSARRQGRIRWVRQRTHRRDRIRRLPSAVRNLALRLAGAAIYRRDYQPLLEEP